MKRLIAVSLFLLTTSSNVHASFILAVNNQDFQVVNIFSDVDVFQIYVEIEGDLAPGIYNNPEIIRVQYQVVGVLTAGTPSGFTSFNLQRDISGEEFYLQGSSLSFEIAESAELSDGVQGDELIDNGTILTFNAREIDNGRFHPALFELYFDGTGRIQNSNNIVRQDPFLQVEFGAEYINDLSFIPEQTTLIVANNDNQPLPGNSNNNGSGVLSPLLLLTLLVLRHLLKNKNRHQMDLSRSTV